MSKAIIHNLEIYCDACRRDISKTHYLKLKWRFSIFRYWKKFDKNGHRKNLSYELCFHCIEEIGKKVAQTNRDKESL